MSPTHSGSVDDTEYLNVFLSHNSEDVATARKLKELLERHDVTVWLAQAAIEPGASWAPELYGAIHRSMAVVILFGPHGAGKWQQEELNQALSARKLIIPILLPGCAGLPEGTNWSALRSRQLIDFRSDDGLNDKGKIGRLAEAVSRTSPESEPGANSVAASGASDPLDWMVPQAKQLPAFHQWIRDLSEMMRGDKPTVDYLVTLYGKSFVTSQDPSDFVGWFYYDLLYYHNLKVPAPMFGPIIPNDYRLKITRDVGRPFEIGKPIDRAKGNFNHREESRVSYWFKLGTADQRLYAIDRWEDVADEVHHEDIGGLLSIMGRKGSWDTQRREGLWDDVMKAKPFLGHLGALEELVHEATQARQINRLGWYSAIDSRRSKISSISRGSVSDSAETVSEFFTAVCDVFAAGTGRDDTADFVFNVLRYNQASKELEFVWNNKKEGEPNAFRHPLSQIQIPYLVAKDTGRHRPLLFHHPIPPRYLDDPITPFHHTDNYFVAANLAVPVLSPDDPATLIGVIDVQSSDRDRFDTDDIQRLYHLCHTNISNFLTKHEHRFVSSLASFALPIVSAPSRDFYDYSEEQARRDLRARSVTAVSQIEFHPGEHCDAYKCPFCYGRDQPQIFDEALGINDYSRILDEIKDDSPLVAISGVTTEPLTFPRILELIEGIRERKMSFGLHTKGYRLGPELIESLTRMPQAGESYVTISLDASEADDYMSLHGIDKDKGLDYFRAVIENLKSLHEPKNRHGSSLRVNVACLLFEENSDRDTTSHFVTTVKKHCDLIKFSVPHVPNVESSSRQLPKNYLGARAGDVLKRLESDYAGDSQVRVLAGTSDSRHETRFKRCYAQLFQVVVDRSGNVFPCPQTATDSYRWLSYGNVRQDPLKTILSSAQRRHLLQMKIDDGMNCRVCDRKDEEINLRYARLFPQPD